MPKKSGKFNAAASTNPLINPPQMPYGAPAFDKVKTEHFEPALNWALDKLKDEIDAIKDNDDAPDFENTIEALELAGSDLSRVMSVFHVYASNNADDEIRALEAKFDDITTPVFSDIAMDDVLFARIKAVYDAKASFGLDHEQNMLLDKTYNSRVRSGALLEGKDKKRFKEISTKLAQLTTKYSQNTVKGTAAFERIATEDELTGVPERAMKAYKAAADKAIQASVKAFEKAQIALETIEDIDPAAFKTKKARNGLIEDAAKAVKDAEEAMNTRTAELSGKYLLKMQPFPDEVLTHCENRELRKEINDAFGSICNGGKFDNTKIILEIVKLRHEAAQILGFKNHSDFVLSDRMAGSQKTVEDFLEKNLNAYKPSAEDYFNSIKAYAEASGEIDEFKPEDFSYYSRKLKEEKFDFDTEKLRPYFEVGAVFDGFRQHIEKLFGVEMVDCSDEYPVYRDDAKVYEVRDKDNGKTVALFYTDYFADAESKRGGAWMNDFRARALDKHGVDNIPLITNSCNYQAPTEDQPSLLSLREVQTLFHEGGHGFHGALAEGKYSSLNGTNVKWDFVELPSQIQENWATEKEVLDTFAKHYETGEAIPQEYIDKIHEMGTYDAGWAGLRQTSFGLLDMMWHTTDPATITSAEQIEDAVHAKTSFWKERSSMMSPRFGHLFSSPVGYSSGYYSYKWAEVLDADMFEEFKKNGLYDKKTARRMRDTIYSRGGTVAPMELFKAMMGREPDPDALFRREGILDEKPAQDPGAAAAPTAPKAP